MNDLPRSLKRLIRLVRLSALLAIAMQVMFAAIVWTQADLLRALASELSGLPGSEMLIDRRAQWLGFLGSLPTTAVWIFGLWQLQSLFGQYEAGRFFAANTHKHLGRFAWALLGATLLTPLERAWYSVAFSMGMPPGQRQMHIGADLSAMIAALLTSATLLAIAQVLSGASRMADRSRELEVASAAKSRFLAAASHDLRQPVVSISLLTELLREQPLPATAIPILARIGDSVQALNQLLKGLLDLSRFEAGTVQAHLSHFGLRQLLARTIGDEVEAARRKGIALRFRSAPFEIHSDALLLEQILRNLIGNAVRFTRRGGVLVSARRRGADRVVLQVWDTGPGIPPQSQSRVFDEFVQLDPDRLGQAGGLGLGLSLVRRAAGVLGVPLTLRSVVGRGTCFSIELPLAGFESAQVSAVAAAASGVKGQQVWIVEDDARVREALRLRLVGWGATVRDFGNADSVREALVDAAGNVPDLLISDQRLPDGTGVEVAQSLRQAAGMLPVLIVTGDTAPHDIALLHSSGLPVLHKPFTSEGLLAAIQALGLGDRLR